MHSQLIPGLPIQSFGLCVAVGVLLSWMLVERLSGRKDLGNLVFALVAAGIVGARIVHVVEYWHADGFDRNFLSVFSIWNGGLVFYGGLVASAVVFAVWCAVKRPDVLALADVLCVGLPLGHAFGRIGCFFHGCCWGKVSDSFLAVTFPAGSPVWAAHHASPYAPRSLPVLPTQLFEAAALFALFAALLLLWRRRRGYTAAAYMLGYGVIRFFMEFLRDDERPFALGLSSAQLFSFALIAAGAAFMAWSVCRDVKRSRDNR
jgi:phosphatidylglycerol:prolipoprotein diacylglycerol transferase